VRGRRGGRRGGGGVPWPACLMARCYWMMVDLMECRSLLMECTALLTEFRALLMECKALLISWLVAIGCWWILCNIGHFDRMWGCLTGCQNVGLF